MCSQYMRGCSLDTELHPIPQTEAVALISPIEFGHHFSLYSFLQGWEASSLCADINTRLSEGLTRIWVSSLLFLQVKRRWLRAVGQGVLPPSGHGRQSQAGLQGAGHTGTAPRFWPAFLSP